MSHRIGEKRRWPSSFEDHLLKALSSVAPFNYFLWDSSILCDSEAPLQLTMWLPCFVDQSCHGFFGVEKEMFYFQLSDFLSLRCACVSHAFLFLRILATDVKPFHTCTIWQRYYREVVKNPPRCLGMNIICKGWAIFHQQSCWAGSGWLDYNISRDSHIRIFCIPKQWSGYQTCHVQQERIMFLSWAEKTSIMNHCPKIMPSAIYLEMNFILHFFLPIKWSISPIPGNFNLFSVNSCLFHQFFIQTTRWSLIRKHSIYSKSRYVCA